MLERRDFLKLLAAVPLAGSAMGAVPASGTPSPLGVYTRSGNNLRTGVYQDSTFTPANIAQRGLKSVFGPYTLSMEGDRVGADSQPLIAPGVTVQDGTQRDLCLVSAQNGLLYAFDANTSDIVWVEKVGRPVNGSQSIDYWGTNDHQGIFSTGVVDPTTNIWYIVAWVSPDGTPNNGTHSIYGLNLKDGSFAFSPVLMPAEFDAVWRKQRTSLCLATFSGRKTIFGAAGTVLEVSSTSAGYLFAFDIPTHKIALYKMAQTGWGAGVWMSGNGLVIDEAKGWIFGVTGNGSFDPVNHAWAETAFRAGYTVDQAGNGVITINDWFTPYRDSWRTANAAIATDSRPAGHSLSTSRSAASDLQSGNPINHMMEPHVMPNGTVMSDEDLGSGPPIYIPAKNMLIAAGKDGIAYLMNASNLGKTSLSEVDNPAVNFAKLLSPPIWLDAFPGFGVSAASPSAAQLNQNVWFDSKTHHQHFGSVVYASRNHGTMVICGGENSNVRAWTANDDGTLTYLANSDDVASPDLANQQYGGMTGWSLAATSSGILIAIRPHGDANKTTTQGDLFLYDLENFNIRPDGSAQLALLWRSDQPGHGVDPIYFLFNKFCPPVVYNGKLYVPTFGDETLVLGLN